MLKKSYLITKSLLREKVSFISKEDKREIIEGFSDYKPKDDDVDDLFVSVLLTNLSEKEIEEIIKK
jgi:hypothetical protein